MDAIKTSNEYSLIDKLDILKIEEEKVGRIREWPIDLKIITQVVIGIVIVLTPLLLRYFHIL